MNALRLLLLAAIAAVGAGAVGADGRGSAAQSSPRPNILVFETDDQTLESMRAMPQVRSLIGAQGATFDNSFVTFSLCCPSRATFLTGQYNHNNGVMGNAPPIGGYAKLDHANTVAVWLQRAGYHTAHLGKFLNGYGRENRTEVPPGWSEWHGSIDPTTYNFANYVLNENGTLVQPGGYQTDVYAERASEIVRRRAPQAQPFFLWVAFLAPHSGGPRDADDPRMPATPSPAARHRDRFAAEPLPAVPSFNEADVSDKPATVRNRPRLGPVRVANVTEMYRQRLESLLAVDEAVARVIDSLLATGELENTLIVFTSDNGFMHGEHRIPNGKVVVYEPSIRVPLLLRGPGIPRGVRVEEPVANIDLAPTFVDVANARASRVLDGRSLLPVVRDRTRRTGRDILIERGPGNGDFRALRTPRYKWVEHADGERELYDLARDPHELESKHSDPAYAAVRTELARRLARLRACAGVACRAGPAVAVASRCSRARVRLAVGGADARLVRRADFFVRGRRVASDARAPFGATLGARPPRVVRARLALLDGHVVTRDRRVACR